MVHVGRRACDSRVSGGSACALCGPMLDPATVSGHARPPMGMFVRVVVSFGAVYVVYIP